MIAEQVSIAIALWKAPIVQNITRQIKEKEEFLSKEGVKEKDKELLIQELKTLYQEINLTDISLEHVYNEVIL